MNLIVSGDVTRLEAASSMLETVESGEETLDHRIEILRNVFETTPRVSSFELRICHEFHPPHSITFLSSVASTSSLSHNHEFFSQYYTMGVLYKGRPGSLLVKLQYHGDYFLVTFRVIGILIMCFFSHDRSVDAELKSFRLRLLRLLPAGEHRWTSMSSASLSAARSSTIILMHR
jgi:hypothetical protein